MSDQKGNWTNQYEAAIGRPVYPTEWVVRTIAGGNYPNLKMDKSRYPGSKILDMSCGDGRNLQMLLNLGFVVYASEISEGIVAPLRERFPRVIFNVGWNQRQPHPDGFFDYILSSAACYYLEPGLHFDENLREFSRILAPGGRLIANFPDLNNYVLAGARPADRKGEMVITQDPNNLRNGYRWQTAETEEEVESLFSSRFHSLCIGTFHDNFYGLVNSGFILVATNR